MRQRLALLDFALNQAREAMYLMDRLGHIQYVNDEACRALDYAREDLVRLTVADIDPDWSITRWSAAWQSHLPQGPVVLESCHRKRDGTLFPVEITASHFQYRGVDYKLALVRDITERRQAEGLLRQRERAFRTLVEHMPDIVMRYDLNCHCVYVNPVYERDIGTAPRQALLPGQDPPWWGSMPASDCKSVLRKVMETGVAMQLCVAWPDAQGRAVEYQLHVVAEHDPDGMVYGALAIGRNITPLKEAERHLAASHIQLREMAVRADVAREEERKHIARELHDELGQFLSALRMQISVLRMRFGRGNPIVGEKTASMLSLVDGVIRVVRDLVSSLRPAVLDMGIGSALEWLADEFTKHTAVPCRVYMDEAALQIGADQTIVVFRMIQESLTNITRHADASHVEIALRRRRDTYVLRIRDNGRGFDPAYQKPDSFGLLGLRERAQMLNGRLDIRSSRGTGTSITVTFPVGGGKRSRVKALGGGSSGVHSRPFDRVGEP